MWKPDPDKLVKVMLHNEGEDLETPWAEEIGPDPKRPWRTLVRLGNVPFLHSKPTYEDVLSVEPDEHDGRLTWNAGGVPFEDISSRIHEDAGRWAMIIDYRLDGCDDLQQGFDQLVRAGESAGIVVEGAFTNANEGTGRAYFAVEEAKEPEEVMQLLTDAQLPLRITLVHPVDDDDN